MVQGIQIVLHGGQERLLFVTYLYRVLLHLLAFAAVAVGARFGISLFAAITAKAAIGSHTETREQ